MTTEWETLERVKEEISAIAQKYNIPIFFRPEAHYPPGEYAGYHWPQDDPDRYPEFRVDKAAGPDKTVVSVYDTEKGLIGLAEYDQARNKWKVD